jgi:hypothetical protein
MKLMTKERWQATIDAIVRQLSQLYFTKVIGRQ